MNVYMDLMQMAPVFACVGEHVPGEKNLLTDARCKWCSPLENSKIYSLKFRLFYHKLSFSLIFARM